MNSNTPLTAFKIGWRCHAGSGLSSESLKSLHCAAEQKKATVPHRVQVLTSAKAAGESDVALTRIHRALAGDCQLTNLRSSLQPASRTNDNVWIVTPTFCGIRQRKSDKIPRTAGNGHDLADHIGQHTTCKFLRTGRKSAKRICCHATWLECRVGRYPRTLCNSMGNR